MAIWVVQPPTTVLRTCTRYRLFLPSLAIYSTATSIISLTNVPVDVVQELESRLPDIKPEDYTTEGMTKLFTEVYTKVDNEMKVQYSNTFFVILAPDENFIRVVGHRGQWRSLCSYSIHFTGK